MGENIKAVLFDLDHTLVDTNPEYKLMVLNNALSSFGKSATLEETQYFWLNHDRERIIEEKGILMKDFWNKFYEFDDVVKRGKSTYAYPDAVSLLGKISGKYSLGIITNAPLAVAVEEIKCIGFDFDVVLSANDIPKPNPHYLIKACEELGISPVEAIYFGDDLTDMIAAKNANIKGVLVDRGFKETNGYSPKIFSLIEAIDLIV